jgi:hypothetical protein
MIVNMKKQRRNHLSYLLRMWQTGNEENAVWRALLENPFTRERHGFASLQDLFAFLQARVDDTASQKFETEGGEGGEES